MRLRGIVLAVVLGALVVSPATASALYLTKPAAKQSAAGYARGLCNRVDTCLRVLSFFSFECRRGGPLVVDCPIDLAMQRDTTCSITVRVRLHSTYYRRSMIYSPNCW